MIDKNTLIHLAELSKISMTDEELIDFSDDMTNIIELMDLVKNVDDTIPKRQKPIPFSDLREDAVYKNDSDEKIKDTDFVIKKIM